MIEENGERIKRAWNQKHFPVILRRGKGHKLRVKLPYSSDNRGWLQNGRRNKPDWISEGKYWEIPQAWFNDTVELALRRYHNLYVIQPYREQEVCAPACMNAVGHECQCSCMGANHGAGQSGSWFVVSETFATRWGDQQLACRLMTMA